MNTYNAPATDQFMSTILREDFSPDESDNALTALTVLTVAHPDVYPFDRTFVQADRGHRGATGVRFVVYGESGVERTLRVPRTALSGISNAVETVMAVHTAWRESMIAA